MFSSHKTFSLNNFDNIQPNLLKSSKDRFITPSFFNLPPCENTYHSNLLKETLYSPSFTKPIIYPPKRSLNTRSISSTPFKVLDAPYLQDDFYLNVLDWSSQNNLLVGLSNSIYIWNFSNNQVQKITEFAAHNLATSLAWDLKSENFAVGELSGKVEIWDCTKNQNLLKISDHSERVGSVSLFQNYLITGSRDSNINFYDLRASNKYVNQYS